MKQMECSRKGGTRTIQNLGCAVSVLRQLFLTGYSNKRLTGNFLLVGGGGVVNRLPKTFCKLLKFLRSS